MQNLCIVLRRGIDACESTMNHCINEAAVIRSRVTDQVKHCKGSPSFQTPIKPQIYEDKNYVHDCVCVLVCVCKAACIKVACVCVCVINMTFKR